MKISLETDPTNRMTAYLETDPPALAGLPANLDTLLYWAFISSYEQNMFDQFQHGALSAEAFADLKLDSMHRGPGLCQGNRGKVVGGLLFSHPHYGVSPPPPPTGRFGNCHIYSFLGLS